jgi:hypothetical protein
MRQTLLIALLALAAPLTASAQVVSINIGWASPPPIVEVSPGVQVVQDYGEEVFLIDGHYWVEREGRWYWAPDHRGHWVAAPPERLPVFVRDHRRGAYLHYRHEVRREEHRREAVRRAEIREDRHERHEQRHEERREEHREEHHR